MEQQPRGPKGDLSAEIAFLQEATLEESIAFAYEKKIYYGELVDTEWYRSAEREKRLFIPDADDYRVRKIAEILRALRLNNVSYSKTHAVISSDTQNIHDVRPHKNFRLAAVYFLGDIKPSGTHSSMRTFREQAELKRRLPETIRRTLVYHPNRTAEEIDRFVRGSAGPYLATKIEHWLGYTVMTGLYEILASLDTGLAEISWARYPFFAINSHAPFILLLQRPTLPPDDVIAELRSRTPTEGMTGLMVLQYAIHRHLYSARMFDFDPLWITALTIIAYSYIRATMHNDEWDILEDKAIERLQSTGNIVQYAIVPNEAKLASKILQSEVSYTATTVGSGQTMYFQVLQRMQKEMVAIRSRNIDQIRDLSPGEYSLWESRYIMVTEINKFTIKELGGKVDPILWIREIGALLSQTMGFSTRSGAQIDAFFTRIGRSVIKDKTHRNWINRRDPAPTLLSQTRGTGDDDDDDVIGAQLKQRSWKIAIILVALALRSPSSQYNDFFIKKTSKDYWETTDIIAFVSNTVGADLEIEAMWGAVAYVAYFLYTGPEKTFLELPLFESLNNVRDVFEK